MENKFEFIGVDASLEISLLEYHFICSYNAKDDDYFIVYDSPLKFQTGYKKESELNDLIEGNDFMDEADIRNFLSFVGLTKEEWKATQFVHKLSDMLSYYGTENIMGSNYFEGMDKDEVLERYFIEVN